MGIMNKVVEFIKKHILAHSILTFSFVGRACLSAMSVYAILLFRNHGVDPSVTLGALLGWMWVIWRKWDW